MGYRARKISAVCKNTLLNITYGKYDDNIGLRLVSDAISAVLKAHVVHDIREPRSQMLQAITLPTGMWK
jgi:hypothetical protein